MEKNKNENDSRQFIKAGSYCYKDLSYFFGNSVKTLYDKTKNKNFVFEKLGDFRTPRTGFVISKTFILKYIMRDRPYVRIKDMIPDIWDESGFETIEHLTEQIHQMTNIKLPKTKMMHYVRQAVLELYGKPDGRSKEIIWKFGLYSRKLNEVKLLDDTEVELKQKIFGNDLNRVIEMFSTVCFMKMNGGPLDDLTYDNIMKDTLKLMKEEYLEKVKEFNDEIYPYELVVGYMRTLPVEKDKDSSSKN